MFKDNFSCDYYNECQGRQQEKEANGKTCFKCSICPYAKKRILQELENNKRK